MRVLEYSDLDTRKVKAPYQKVKAALERGDFRAADVSKLTSARHARLYRARLNLADRLLFTLVRHQDEVCILVLEVILNHAYEKSRFLRGAAIDESQLPAFDPAEAAREAEPVRYIHPERPEIHLLDKALSFDDAQEAVYRLPPPVIVVGSAGSGKTALTLSKMKRVDGEVLYVTLSAYLATSARDLYYANAFEREGQEVSFLSYRDFVETLKVPAGREASWRDFVSWFARMRQAFKGLDAHQIFEEIRGVIAADAQGPLDRDRYRALGIKQSIFAADQRDRVYDLFEKYRAWLDASGLYDLNLVARDWRALATPRYDFVVVDEVQDLTPAQLALVLATLKTQGQFLLCGDSNQIVHPNFFSWSKVKSLFWQNPELAERQKLHVLRSNFRNGTEVTRLANMLLKIKQKRFGSIDRESNFLVEAATQAQGSVTVLPDKEATRRELDEKTRASTRFAVLVLRDEDKPEASKHFRTPLVFSIHEAKGLEYENIVLYRFLSGHRQDYAAIAEGISPEDLAADSLEYRRAADKTDKSLEIYKFYVNALYVALTRAISNVYLIESDLEHPLLRLMGVAVGADAKQVERATSSLEDWQREARKLELQGKLEQAEAIRRDVLKQTPVPWTPFDESKVREALAKVFVEQVPAPKFRHQLFDVAACQELPTLASYLWDCTGYKAAKDFERESLAVRRKYFGRFESGVSKEVLKECERHGVDHRTPMNLTPLLTATLAGNLPLVEALLDRGADIEAADTFGCNALHWAMRRAFADPRYARSSFGELYERLAPSSVDLKVGDRFVRLDRHLSEYFLFQAMWATFRDRFMEPYLPAANTDTFMRAYAYVPLFVLSEQRRKRAFLSAVLSRNEMDRDYAYNRRLFLRLSQGWYQFNPQLAVRRRGEEQDTWTPIFQGLNLPLIKEFTDPIQWDTIDHLLLRGDLPVSSYMPVAGKLLLAQRGKAR